MSLAGDRGDKDDSTFPAVHFCNTGREVVGEGGRKIQNQIWFMLIKQV